MLGCFLQGINEAAQGGGEETTLERWLVYSSSRWSQTGKMSLDFPHPMAHQEVVLMCWERRWGLSEALIERRAFPSLPSHRTAGSDSDFPEMLLSRPAQRSLGSEGGIAAPGKAALCPFTGCWWFPGLYRLVKGGFSFQVFHLQSGGAEMPPPAWEKKFPSPCDNQSQGVRWSSGMARIRNGISPPLCFPPQVTQLPTSPVPSCSHVTGPPGGAGVCGGGIGTSLWAQDWATLSGEALCRPERACPRLNHPPFGHRR